MNLSRQFFLSVLVLFLIYPILKYKIDVDKIVKLCGVVMAIYTGIAFLIIVAYPDLSFSQSFYYDFFKVYSHGSNGLREFAEEGTLSFHLGTVPFIYLSFVLYMISFVEKKTFTRLIVLIGLFIVVFISASRGAIIITLGASAFIVFFKTSLKNKIIFLAITIPLTISVVSYFVANTNVFDSSDGSNSVKIGHAESFFESRDIYNLVIGEGLGSYYYSKGSQAMKAHTEITPFDMIRYLGIVFTIILYTVIIFPVRQLKSYLGENFLYVVIFLIYVINSFSNPTFFNSYGLLIVLWYWYKIINGSEPKMEAEKLST